MRVGIGVGWVHFYPLGNSGDIVDSICQVFQVVAHLTIVRDNSKGFVLPLHKVMKGLLSTCIGLVNCRNVCAGIEMPSSSLSMVTSLQSCLVHKHSCNANPLDPSSTRWPTPHPQCFLYE